MFFVVTPLKQFEMEVLQRLSSKALPKGYLAELLDQEYFRQWIRILIDTPPGAWFKKLSEDNQVVGVSQFEEAYQEAIKKCLI